MSLRSIPTSMNEERVASIDAALEHIERDHGVVIGLAVESGSRAWGFPSPDSDYDCRFVYIRPLDHYLTPWPRRDVIELPLVDELDVNGWDLAKSLQLLMKGNAVIIEWLTSPLVYRGDDAFRTEFLALARTVADRGLVLRHYQHVGLDFRKRFLSDLSAVPLKKLFYAVRPAVSIRWLAQRPDAAVADLLARKTTTRELGTGPLAPTLAEFVDEQLKSAEEYMPTQDPNRREEHRVMCEEFFRNVARRSDLKS